MKLHLSSSLRKAILACMFAATVPVFSASAGTSYLAEDVNPEDVFSCARFYDTGKGYYFSWDKSYWLDLYRVMARNGSFAFLGDLYERFSSNQFDLNQASLTDDSDTCWAQVSMNLVEYWHSYYGVFCKDPRGLIYGRSYGRQYLDETQGKRIGKYDAS